MSAGREPGALVPNGKVTAGGLAGSLVTVAAYVASSLGYDVPAEVAAAATTLAAWGVSYLVPGSAVRASKGSGAGSGVRVPGTAARASQRRTAASSGSLPVHPDGTRLLAD